MAIELKQDALEQLRKVYEDKLVDQMGELYNKFSAYVSESILPLPHALMVIELLRDATIEQARKRYLGE